MICLVLVVTRCDLVVTKYDLVVTRWYLLVELLLSSRIYEITSRYYEIVSLNYEIASISYEIVKKYHVTYTGFRLLYLIVYLTVSVKSELSQENDETTTVSPGIVEELFSETAVGCTASYFVKIIWCSCWFCNPPPPYFAVAEGWLLLDIGWFVLFS